MRNIITVFLYLLRVALAGAAGAFGGWWLMQGFCSRWLFGESVVCGHNAFIPLFLLVPLAGLMSWFLLAPVTWSVKRSGNPPNRAA
jgi:hypothetical protein